MSAGGPSGGDGDVTLGIPLKDRRPELNAEDLQREVPVPDEGDLDDEGPSNSGPSAAAASNAGGAAGSAASEPAVVSDEAVKGHWLSESGECSIGEDRITSRLAYEEELSGGGRLHGWLNKKEEAGQVWEASLAVLDDGQAPWYGPSFGKEPEAVGDIQVRLFAGPPVALETRIRVAGEDTDWQPAVAWRRKPQQVLPKAPAGVFVFGS